MLTSRSGSLNNAASASGPSIEEIRRRARHRLMGAAVLVALGVVGFPLLFDTQPRPIAVDIPIEIPARNEAALVAATPAGLPAASVAASPERGNGAAPTVSTSESLGEREEVVTATAPASRVVAPSVPPEEAVATDRSARSRVSGSPAKTLPQSSSDATSAEPARAVNAAAPVSASAAKTAVAAAPAQTAAASNSTTSAPERSIVQVGAFADNARAQEVRWQLERAGLKTYTHVAETAEGRRIRVRLGPFSNRADAEKAAERARALGLPAAILTL